MQTISSSLTTNQTNMPIIKAKKDKKDKPQNFLDKLAKLNGNEDFKTNKLAVKFANRTVKTITTIYEFENPVLAIIPFALKELRHGFRFMHSVVTLYTAGNKLKFISKTLSQKLPTPKAAQKYFENFFQSFLFGGCEERRRLIKTGLSIVMIGALSTYLASQTGSLESVCQAIWGQEEGAKYAMMLLATSTNSIKTWQNCRRLLAAETVAHKCIIATATPETVKKQQKRYYSMKKVGLLGARYLFKVTELKFFEKLSATLAAGVSFFKPVKPKKAKDKEKTLESSEKSSANDAVVSGDEQKVKKVKKDKKEKIASVDAAESSQIVKVKEDSQVEKKDKKNKLDKVKAPLTGWYACADQTTRVTITLLLFWQLYCFMNILTNPFNQSQFDGNI